MLYIELLIVLSLTVVNGLLAMSELALVSSRKGRLQQMAKEGHRGASAAITLINDPGRFLSTVQIGITLVGVVAGAFSGATLGERLGTWLKQYPLLSEHGYTAGIVVVIVAITYLSLIVGELVPKRIALTNPERTASLVARPMQMLARAASPAVWLLKISTDTVLRLIGLGGARETTISEEEVKSLLAEGTLAGIFVPQERDMIEGVLRLADRTVAAIMTPRPEIVWIDRKADAASIAQTVRESRVSRFLVCDGTVDEAIGVVHAKDMLPDALTHEGFSLEKVTVQAPVVPENKEVLKLLDRFKRERIHIAIVVDEYGVTRGVVTLTDILESIAGELPEAGEEDEQAMHLRSDGSWLVDGAMPIDKLAAQLNLDEIDGGFHTAAGLVLDALGHIPAAGEALDIGGYRFEVADMDGRRIDKLIVTRLPEKSAHGMA
ncbi:MAG: hemolysin family protein [Parvibaculaceae bacterium]|uniref:hemolysin family protein n=1 Tax=Parvibaculum sp. TaxID=2024848 RepID=UPI0032EE95E4